jgi:hypothetical protein
MDTTLYYTFSTIAQSLAGAIAFLGAFVLFRLQSIAVQLRSSTDLIRESWLGDDHLQRTAAANDFQAFLTRVEDLVNGPIPGGWKPKHQAALDAMRISWTQRTEILLNLKRALVLTAIMMTFALIVLAAVAELAAPRVLAISILGAGVLGFTANVLVIGVLVWRVAHGT